jgi:serine O-acetyltransferase
MGAVKRVTSLTWWSILEGASARPMRRHTLPSERGRHVRDPEDLDRQRIDRGREPVKLDPVRLQRAAHAQHLRGHKLVPAFLEGMMFVVFSCVLRRETEIGEGCRLAYRGLGVVIHRRAVLGERVLVGTHVTIGGTSRLEGVPVIGDDCFIATGAKVLGPITIGSVIGANAVVLEDVPAKSLAVGVPARIVRTGIDIDDYVGPEERGSA